MTRILFKLEGYKQSCKLVSIKLECSHQVDISREENLGLLLKALSLLYPLLMPKSVECN